MDRIPQSGSMLAGKAFSRSTPATAAAMAVMQSLFSPGAVGAHSEAAVGRSSAKREVLTSMGHVDTSAPSSTADKSPGTSTEAEESIETSPSPSPAAARANHATDTVAAEAGTADGGAKGGSGAVAAAAASAPRARAPSSSAIREACHVIKDCNSDIIVSFCEFAPASAASNSAIHAACFVTVLSSSTSLTSRARTAPARFVAAAVSSATFEAATHCTSPSAGCSSSNVYGCSGAASAANWPEVEASAKSAKSGVICLWLICRSRSSRSSCSCSTSRVIRPSARLDAATQSLSLASSVSRSSMSMRAATSSFQTAPTGCT
mmetsp:Transcript_50018/g.161817  ORF Transcript_50018/g.161817 Transcript_50018/m.161817 type:complete len:320 (+) Transcript_50018:2565-3524(+)